MGSSRRYDNSVFINCPFDEQYQPMFDALVFAVFDCGFIARCSLEFAGSGGVRIDNISKLIQDCKFGIHDISLTELGKDTGLPRFNMPLELGLFLGAMKLGTSKQREKDCLVLDKAQHRFRMFISDISGQDVEAHDGNVRTAVKRVRDWLNATPETTGVIIPGGRKIADRYEEFRNELPALCEAVRLQPEELTFNDFAALVAGWLQANPWD